jgi:hypothetical protein
MINAERPTSLEVPAEPERLAAELIRVRAEIDARELYFSQLASAFAKTDYWDDEGSATAKDWIRINCKMTSNAAGDRVAVGKNLGRMAESAQAMQAGEIGFAHLTVMARMANAVGDAFDEKQLLEKARDCSPGKFYYRCQHYRHSVQPKVYAAEQAEQVENRRLFLSTAEDGSLILTGVLDPVGGAALRSALEPVTLPHLWGSPGRSPGMGPTTNSASAPPALRATSP